MRNKLGSHERECMAYLSNSEKVGESRSEWVTQDRRAERRNCLQEFSVERKVIERQRGNHLRNS